MHIPHIITPLAMTIQLDDICTNQSQTLSDKDTYTHSIRHGHTTQMILSHAAARHTRSDIRRASNCSSASTSSSGATSILIRLMRFLSLPIRYLLPKIYIYSKHALNILNLFVFETCNLVYTRKSMIIPIPTLYLHDIRRHV